MAGHARFLPGRHRRRGARAGLASGGGQQCPVFAAAGANVTSFDASDEQLARDREVAEREGLTIRTVQGFMHDLSVFAGDSFDAIICLGNSFTHLFDENDRRKALAEFYAALRHDGVLILDQRNYDAILDDGYSSDHTYYYCGDQVTVEPEHMDESLARFRYSFPDGSEFHLNMFPLRKAYMRGMLLDSGFQQVKTYGDFQETYQENDPDFFVHVAEKSYHGD